MKKPSSPYINRFLQPDSIIPDASNPQGWNRYTYTFNRPITNNDPSGHCVEPLTFILCAAAIGAVVSVAVDAIVTTQVKNESYSWEQAGQAALTGAVAGAVGAAVGVVGAAIAGTSLAATVVTGAIASVASGQATRAVTNKLNNRPITEGLFDPTDMVTDAVVGGLTAGAGYKLEKLLEGIGPYSTNRGHHIHAQSAFDGSPNYNSGKAISISQDFMEANGWSHQAMTNTQRGLFTDLANNGAPNTMAAQNQIA